MTHEDFLALKRFPALDGVRAVAALMVVFFHSGGPEWLNGWLGVQVFFVLSGFLITTLLWPLLGFVLLPRFRPAVLAGLMTLALAVVPFTVSADPKGWSVHYFTVLVGCALAMLMHSPRGFALVKPLLRPWLVVPFIAVHLSVGVISGWMDGAIPGFVSVVPVYAIATGLMLPALLVPGLPRRVLSGRVMTCLGERSYSIYLVQAIAHAAVLLTGVSGLVMAVLTALVAIGIADLCYRWVERPMIERGRLSVMPSMRGLRGT